jgi:hypothetical protein
MIESQTVGPTTKERRSNKPWNMDVVQGSYCFAPWAGWEADPSDQRARLGCHSGWAPECWRPTRGMEKCCGGQIPSSIAPAVPLSQTSGAPPCWRLLLSHDAQTCSEVLPYTIEITCRERRGKEILCARLQYYFRVTHFHTCQTPHHRLFITEKKWARMTS